MSNKPLINKFTEKVRIDDVTGCWIWVGGMRYKGYGAFRIGLKHESAHRAAWIIYRGEIPDGLSVCHHCDNPSCVNPDHLFLGTAKDNTQDMIQKGRQVSGLRLHPERAARGEHNGNSKLTEDEVRAIRLSYSLYSISKSELARWYHVDHKLISEIVNYRIWKHVE